MNAGIKKLIFGTSAPLQIGADRSGSDRRTWANENLYLGGETDTSGIHRVIEWLDAKAVARHEKLPPGVIVDDEGEHSLEPIEQSVPPARVTQQKRLGVACPAPIGVAELLP